MRFLSLACLLGLWVQSAPAQDSAGWIEELRELRKAVELQSKQIEVLTQQVAKLAAANAANAASAGKSTEPSVTTSSEAAPAPAAAPTAPGKDDFNVANAPKAEAVPHHVIVKGETLTSIAKQYNVSLNDLMKANKGLDARKLQIGQSILLPATPASTQTTPSESKPNP